jgi:hypothetical protein
MIGTSTRYSSYNRRWSAAPSHAGSGNVAICTYHSGESGQMGGSLVSVSILRRASRSSSPALAA